MPFSPPTLHRSDIKKTPGRLVWDPTGANVSIYSKLNTFIERTLVHELLTIGTDPGGELDYRDREFYGRVRITPDGRYTAALAAVLWPYANYVPGAPIFTDGGDKVLQVHANDGTGTLGENGSLETFSSAKLDVMPPITFAATETLVGQAEWLCIRSEQGYWSTSNSLVTQADVGASMIDSTFSPPGIITGPYFALWAPVTPLTISGWDTLDGFHVEFTMSWSDDNRQSVGLYNRRIKAVGCRMRCTPLGVTRQSILAAEQGQGAGAVRGRSIQAGNSADLTIVDIDGNPRFTLYNAALTEDKQAWGTDPVREGDLVWMATRTYTSGSLNPLFAVHGL